MGLSPPDFSNNEELRDLFNHHSMRDEKVKQLRAIRQLEAQNVLTDAVGGQYVAGKMEWRQVAGCHEPRSSAPDSATKNRAAFRLSIDNSGWSDRPIIIRTGKCVPQRVSEFGVYLKQALFLQRP